MELLPKQCCADHRRTTTHCSHHAAESAEQQRCCRTSLPSTMHSVCLASMRQTSHVPATVQSTIRQKHPAPSGLVSAYHLTLTTRRTSLRHPSLDHVHMTHHSVGGLGAMSHRRTRSARIPGDCQHGTVGATRTNRTALTVTQHGRNRTLQIPVNRGGPTCSKGFLRRTKQSHTVPDAELLVRDAHGGEPSD